MTENWRPAERVQKNDAGEFRALINGNWTSVLRAQKNESGEFRVLMPEPTEDQRLRASMPARAVQGVRDFIDAGTQMMVNAVPEGAINAVNQGVAAVNRMPFIGPATVALGMTPATREQVNAGIQDNERQYQMARAVTGSDGIDVARIGGNIGVTAPFGAAMRNPATLMGKVATGAGFGAASGAMQPVTQPGDFWSQKAEQAGVGAAIGGAVPLAISGGARVIRPNTRPEVEALMREGVTPTPGQIMGGALQRAEEKMTSIPIVGDAIAYAQRRGVDELNRAAYARALNPIGGQVPRSVGRDAVASVKSQLGEAYDALLPQMGFSADNVFQGRMAQLTSMVNSLPRREARQFDSIIKREVTDRLTGSGLASGETLKTIESQLGKEVKKFSGSTDAYQKSLSDALKEAQAVLRETIKRQNPRFSSELESINRGYANYARIRDAASRQGSADGVFTPAQLAAAVRAGDKTVGKGGYATGQAYMQDLSDAGKNVLAQKYPDSGTAGRLLGGIAAGGGAFAIHPLAAMAGGLATLPYLPGGRQVTAALLARRPEQAALIAQQLRKLPVAPSALVANQVLQAQE